MEMASTIVMGTPHNHSFILPGIMEPGAIIKAARLKRGWSQAKLGKEAGGLSQPAIKKIEDGNTRQTKFLPQIGAALGIPVDRLVPGASDAGPHPAGVGVISDLRLHAAAEGGPGEIIVSSDPVDYIARPPELRFASDAYAILVVGESMVPEFRPGDVAMVNPSLPIIGETTCIFFAEREGEARASIKHLRRQSAENWLITQWNPQRDFSLPRKEWRWVHRVVQRQLRR
jgi:transcriptional regulator with XRE-family HTH domain